MTKPKPVPAREKPEAALDREEAAGRRAFTAPMNPDPVTALAKRPLDIGTVTETTPDAIVEDDDGDAPAGLGAPEPPRVDLRHAMLDQWETAAAADLAAGDPFVMHPGTMLSILPAIRAAIPDPVFARCPVETCPAPRSVVRVTDDWQDRVRNQKASVPLIGCGNPWHYAERTMADPPLVTREEPGETWLTLADVKAAARGETGELVPGATEYLVRISPAALARVMAYAGMTGLYAVVRKVPDGGA